MLFLVIYLHAVKSLHLLLVLDDVLLLLVDEHLLQHILLELCFRSLEYTDGGVRE